MTIVNTIRGNRLGDFYSPNETLVVSFFIIFYFYQLQATSGISGPVGIAIFHGAYIVLATFMIFFLHVSPIKTL